MLPKPTTTNGQAEIRAHEGSWGRNTGHCAHIISSGINRKCDSGSEIQTKHEASKFPAVLIDLSGDKLIINRQVIEKISPEIIFIPYR